VTWDLDLKSRGSRSTTRADAHLTAGDLPSAYQHPGRGFSLTEYLKVQHDSAGFIARIPATIPCG
jgi:hypothetical protein